MCHTMLVCAVYNPNGKDTAFSNKLSTMLALLLIELDSQIVITRLSFSVILIVIFHVM